MSTEISLGAKPSYYSGIIGSGRQKIQRTTFSDGEYSDASTYDVTHSYGYLGIGSTKATERRYRCRSALENVWKRK